MFSANSLRHFTVPVAMSGLLLLLRLNAQSHESTAKRVGTGGGGNDRYGRLDDQCARQGICISENCVSIRIVMEKFREGRFTEMSPRGQKNGRDKS
jgi:hypothetical protein